LGLDKEKQALKPRMPLHEDTGLIHPKFGWTFEILYISFWVPFGAFFEVPYQLRLDVTQKRTHTHTHTKLSKNTCGHTILASNPTRTTLVNYYS